MIEIKAVLYQLDRNYKISHKEISTLVNYLMGINEWSTYEIWLFSNCVSLFNDKDLRELTTKMIHPELNNIKTDLTQSKLNLALLNAISIFIEAKHFAPIHELFVYLDTHIHSDLNTYERASLTYHKAIFAFRQEPKSPEKLKKVESCISALEILGCFDLVNLMNDELQKYKKESQI